MLDPDTPSVLGDDSRPRAKELIEKSVYSEMPAFSTNTGRPLLLVPFR